MSGGVDVDLRNDFRQKVRDYFSASYFKGLTPNPCVVCNGAIKFGAFLDAVRAAGMDYMGTGHYATIRQDAAGYHLYDGLDNRKNQSYFLARLTGEQLAHSLFPLGTWQKEEVYAFLKKHGFSGWQEGESQDICFMEGRSLGEYLAEYSKTIPNPGPIVDTTGRERGCHEGLYKYTIGQRRGLGLPDATPWYVAGMDVEKNQLIVCKEQELFKQTITIKDLHCLGPLPVNSQQIFRVKLRYSHRGSPATIHCNADGSTAEIVFEEPQRAVTPGQFAVWYDGSELLGSGVIVK